MWRTITLYVHKNPFNTEIFCWLHWIGNAWSSIPHDMPTNLHPAKAEWYDNDLGATLQWILYMENTLFSQEI